ncbi:PKD domain-containing protein [Flaviaesturariibacter amylovorans]|uniref:PKD domain-containing protein n=1 Tax=Flaviaesturariibacter amylovorans TaxID=1084520 RepID=UPI0031E4F32A
MLFQKRFTALFLGCAALAASALSCSKKGGTDNTPVVANFTFSGAGLAPATVSFTNSSSGATSYQWDFGDNTPSSSSSSPSHNYTQGGVYTVRLTATGPGGSNTVSKTVNIGTPTSLKITKVRLAAMPFTTTSGGSWDPGSGPDVFFQFKSSAGSVLFSGSPLNDATAASLPIAWTLSTPYQVTNFATPYSLEIYDNDSPLSNDVIGAFSNFNFTSATTNGYPTTLLLQSANGQLRVELVVQWQ